MTRTTIASILIASLLVACQQAGEQTLPTTESIPAWRQAAEDTLPASRAVGTQRSPATQLAVSTGDPSLAMEVGLLEAAVMPGGHARMIKAVPDVIWQPGPRTRGETYDTLTRSSIVRTADQPVSTFSIDVDTGAYANVRRFLQQGQLPPADAVRTEELLNYFQYEHAAAASSQEPFSLTTELVRTPWNQKTRLLQVGLQGHVPAGIEEQPANLVFLIDVSGSMQAPDKLDLLVSSLRLMLPSLDAQDRISIVTYAGSAGVALEPTAGDQHGRIERALMRLRAGGSTHGSDGIQQAYAIAREQFIVEGVNRVILATDGDFNVGVSDIDTLKRLIARHRDSGIALTTLGFGQGNYNDHLMEQLADTGNGNHAYIDTLSEAQKVLVEERHSTLMTIAQDVKIQIEFNPAVVSEYRLIGYQNRVLANEDFNNDHIDAGEIGAGHRVTALYEVAIVGEGGEVYSPRRYRGPKPGGRTTELSRGEDSWSDPFEGEVAELRVRYKRPGKASSQMSRQIVHLTDAPASDNARFAASVAAFAQLLRGDERVQDFDFEQVHALAASARGTDPFGYRGEFLTLVKLAASLNQLGQMDPLLRGHDEG